MNKLMVIPLHVCSGMMKNYSYIIFQTNSRKAIVIDPAWEFEKYLDVFNEFSITPTTILLTHTHYDHVNLVDTFLDRYSVTVWVANQEKNKLYFDTRKVYTFSHEEILLLNNIPCKAYITPGHTPGSSCFLIKEHLFTGDTLFIEGCGMCFDEEANPEELYHSIMFLKKSISANVKIYPGHRYNEYPGKFLSEVLKKNIYLHMESQEMFVKFRMRPFQNHLFDFK